MEIKRQAIAYILKKEQASLEEGQAICQQLTRQIMTSKSQIIAFLGSRLRSGDFTVIEQVVEKPKPLPHPAPIETEEETPDHYDLSTSAKVAIDLDRMTKILNAKAQDLTQATSDKARKLLYKECDTMLQHINYNKKIARELQKGNKVTYSNTYFQPPEETDFDVPENLFELDKKCRNFRTRRSKRKTKLVETEAKQGKDSLAYQQVLDEWKHYDEVVKHLESKINEYQKPTS